MRQWQTDGRNRDAARFIRALRSRAPFSSVLTGEVHETTEYTYDDNIAFALGAAHLRDGLAVSLRLSPSWDPPRLLLRRCVLVEDDADFDATARCTESSMRLVFPRIR